MDPFPTTAMTSVDGDFATLHGEIEHYYTAKVQAHGPSALGVDWTCKPSQELRFVQLLKLCNRKQAFSLNDFGCGYGALRHFLDNRFGDIEIDYLGLDISPEMVKQARQMWPCGERTNFVVGDTLPRIADYSLASGVFNVKLHQPHARWTRFVKQTLAMLGQFSRVGFAVNFLAPTTNRHAQVEELYRTSEGIWLAYCRRVLGLDVEVITDYGMNEFTLIARRQANDVTQHSRL